MGADCSDSAQAQAPDKPARLDSYAAVYVRYRHWRPIPITSASQSHVRSDQHVYDGSQESMVRLNMANSIPGCSWLRRNVNIEEASKARARAWELAPCPMLMSASCLVATSHLDIIEPLRPGGSDALYKARVLRDIRQRMVSPKTATSDETITALCLLTMFEVSQLDLCWKVTCSHLVSYHA